MAKASYSDLVALQQTLYTSQNPSRRYLHTIRKNWVVSRIKTYAGKGRGRVLEVGPGAGFYLPVLLEAAQRVWVSDREAAFLAHLASYRKKGVSLVNDDITRTRIAQGSMDFILCTEVIEHIKASRAALDSLFRILNPGGILILTTPQKFSPLEILSNIAYLPGIIDLVRLVYKEPILKAGHINLMTEKQLIRQIRSAGFCIVEQQKTGLYLPLVAEFAGRAGRDLAVGLEKKIKGTGLDFLLWTQYYVLTKPLA